MKITLDDIEQMDCEFLDIPTIAKYLGKSVQPVRQSIRNGVPWGYIMGNADFRVPRRAFVNYHKYGACVLERTGGK